MPADNAPLPQEQLLPDWGPVDVAADRISYQHYRLSIELIAERAPADHIHPSLGLGQSWVLEYRRQIGDLVTSGSIGRVSTRQAALDGLLACMHRLHDSSTEIPPTDPIDLQSVLERVSLDTLIHPQTSEQQRHSSSEE